MPESSTLTTWLPSHPMLLRHLLYRYFTCVFLCLVMMMSGWCCEAVRWNQRGVYAGRRCYQDRVLSLCCWLHGCIACQCNSTRGHRVSPEVCVSATDIDTHTHPFNDPLSGTTQVSRYQKGKTNLDFTEARDSEWQWHQLGYMQVCTSLQTDNHASTPQVFYRPDALPAAQPTVSKH